MCLHGNPSHNIGAPGLGSIIFPRKKDSEQAKQLKSHLEPRATTCRPRTELVIVGFPLRSACLADELTAEGCGGLRHMAKPRFSSAPSPGIPGFNSRPWRGTRGSRTCGSVWGSYMRPAAAVPTGWVICQGRGARSASPCGVSLARMADWSALAALSASLCAAAAALRAHGRASIQTPGVWPCAR